jgi:hypothetical protein
MVDSGALEILKVTPAFPPTRYVALYRADQRSSLIASVTTLAQECCDFTRIFQTDLPSSEANTRSGVMAGKRGDTVQRRRVRLP